jgi:hypothetical protein
VNPLATRSALPVEVVIDGREFPIHHDFRDGVRFEEMANDARLSGSAKLSFALGIWYGRKLPEADLGAVIERMLWFYRCGKPEHADMATDRRSMSFAQDWDAIYSGFLAAYGIDLLDPDTDLHWWKFRSMLGALPEDSQLMRIIGYRTAKTTKGMSKEQKAQISKMKRYYELDDGGVKKVRISSDEDLDAALASVIASKQNPESMDAEVMDDG